MYGLPERTKLKPARKMKEALRKHLDFSQREKYQNIIQSVTWYHKLSADDLNIGKGKQVNEIEILELGLNQSDLPEILLRSIDKVIPYHLLFVCKYQESCQLWMSYKLIEEKGIKKIGSYYHSEWQLEEKVQLNIQALDMDELYSNLLRSLGGDLLIASQGESLSKTVERSEEKMKLQKKIDQLQRKMRKEVQLNRKIEMNKEIKALRQELLKI